MKEPFSRQTRDNFLQAPLDKSTPASWSQVVSFSRTSRPPKVKAAFDDVHKTPP